jgi:hypothetical protein
VQEILIQAIQHLSYAVDCIQNVFFNFDHSRLGHFG